MMHGHQGEKEKRCKKEAMIQQKIYIWRTKMTMGRELREETEGGKEIMKEKHTSLNKIYFSNFDSVLVQLFLTQ